MAKKERQQRQLTTEPPVATVPGSPESAVSIIGKRQRVGTVDLDQNVGATASDPRRERSPEIELLLKALRIAGSSRKLAEWIQTPVPAVNGRTPYALMQSEEGRKQVDAVLGRIEHGVY